MDIEASRFSPLFLERLRLYPALSFSIYYRCARLIDVSHHQTGHSSKCGLRRANVQFITILLLKSWMNTTILRQPPVLDSLPTILSRQLANFALYSKVVLMVC